MNHAGQAEQAPSAPFHTDMQQLRNALFVMLVTALAAGAAAGCASGQAAGEAADDVTPPRIEIHYSSGGGVSGMSSGFSILEDGTVTQWTGRAARVNDARILGRLDAAEHVTLLETVTGLDLAGLRQQENGNMTTTLRIVRDDEEYLFTWPGLHQRAEDVPEAVRPLRDAVWQCIEPFRSEHP